MTTQTISRETQIYTEGKKIKILDTLLISLWLTGLWCPLLSHVSKDHVLILFLEYNCFTVLCQFLLNNKVNQSPVQFSGSVVSDSLQPHGLKHTRLPCPSPTPGACSNSCPLSQSCNPTISFFVIPFSSCLHSFPASASFAMSQFFASGGQSLEFQLQHESFQWIFRTDSLYDWLVWFPCRPRDS